MYAEGTPLFSLTIGEFIVLTTNLVQEALKSKDQEKKQEIENIISEEHFNIQELAQFLKCSKVSVHKYKKKGLPFYRIGRKVLFKKTEVLNFMQSLKNRKRIQ